MYILKITYSSRQRIKESSLLKKKKLKYAQKHVRRKIPVLGYITIFIATKDFFKYYFFITIDIIRDLAS